LVLPHSKETVFLIKFGVFYNKNKILTILFIVKYEKSHNNEQFLVLWRPIISKFFVCLNEDPSKHKACPHTPSSMVRERERKREGGRERERARPHPLQA
jgi:hypothetical protein